MLSRDGIAGLICLAVSAWLLWLTHDLPGPSLLVPVGPGFYPRIVLGVTAALSALLVATDIFEARRRLRGAQRAAAPERNYRLVATTFAIVGIYVALLPYLGYRIATFAFVSVLQAAIEPPRNAKKWLLLVAVALITTVVTYYVFEQYLFVLLPRGHWTDF